MNARIRSVAQVALFVAVAFASSPAFAVMLTRPCAGIPNIANLETELQGVLDGGNGGLGLGMWAAIVNRDGLVCSVVFSGADRQTQWPGSRVIAMQKAYTANAFSLDGLALSTANLYSLAQPGGSLFGLQESNPVNAAAAYAGPATAFGTANLDPAVLGLVTIGGINVFGGGLGLYTEAGIVGGIGVSGDTSCTDHIVAWRLRDALGLDFVPAGVSPTGDDNTIPDIVGSNGNFKSKGGFGHPTCDPTATNVAKNLPTSNPIGN